MFAKKSRVRNQKKGLHEMSKKVGGCTVFCTGWGYTEGVVS